MTTLNVINAVLTHLFCSDGCLISERELIVYEYVFITATAPGFVSDHNDALSVLNTVPARVLVSNTGL